jgi:prolyl-tRNA editing enzyme YbaK/EbsC (Cys-tRNA(Pro) deacylase)
MEIGGVTPIGLPAALPVWIDARIMALDYIILGGGNRASKLKVGPGLLRTIDGVEIIDGLAKPLPATS